MPRRYQINVSFDLSTEIEADFYRHDFDTGDVEEFSDESNFYAQGVEAEGGSLMFVVTAEDETEAEEKATEVISEGGEMEDRSGLTWLIQNVSYDIEAIEVPMDLARAKELILAFLAAMEGMDEELKEAFTFVLDAATSTPFGPPAA